MNRYYAIVVNYDQKTNLAQYLVMNDTFTGIVQRVSTISLEDLGIACVKQGILPYNFSVDRSGKVIQDAGKFERLSMGKAYVVIGEWVGHGGKKLGYKLINSKQMLEKVALGYIVDKAKSSGDATLLQNGIVRDDTVACYSGHPFPQLEYKRPTTPKAKAKAKSQPTKTGAKKQSVKKTEEDMFAGFTEAQKKELKVCQKHGIDIKLIYNRALSPEQMRVIWLSKERGSASEYFNNPELSEDSMKWYAKQVKSQEEGEFFKPLIAKTQIKPEMLKKLKDTLREAYTYGVDIAPELGSPYLEVTKSNLKRAIALKKRQHFDDNNPNAVSNKSIDIQRGASLRAKEELKRLADPTAVDEDIKVYLQEQETIRKYMDEAKTLRKQKRAIEVKYKRLGLTSDKLPESAKTQIQDIDVELDRIQTELAEYRKEHGYRGLSYAV